MECPTSIKIILEGGQHFDLASPTNDRTCPEDRVFRLSRDGHTRTIPIPELHLDYKIQVPAFGRSHILVRTQDEDSMVVYGVQCGENSRLSCDQIVNRVRDIFGVDVSENLTANNTPENIEILNGEPGYPCGTLFTSGLSCSNSSSYTPTTPPHTPHPHIVTRPGRLPLTMSNLKSTLITPRPVATPNTNLPRNHAIVACNGSFNMPGDQRNGKFDDSVPTYGEEDMHAYREGMVKVPTFIHQTLEPAQKVQRGNAELTNQIGVVNLDTPDQNDQNATFQGFVPPKFHMTIQDDDSTPSKSPASYPVEHSSQESDQRLSGQPEHFGSLVTSMFDKKSLGNQLVVGIGIGQPRRKLSVSSQEPLLPKGSFGRQLSLPGEKLNGPFALPRNASEDCLEKLEGNTEHGRSFSNLELKLGEEPMNVEPGVNVGHTPTTPTKPLAVERQESVASPELVVNKNSSMLFHDNNQIEDAQHQHVLNGLLPKITEKQSGEADTSDDLDDRREVPTGDVAPGDVVPSPTEDSPVTQDKSSGDLMQQQVHFLEHAMNGYCCSEDLCRTVDQDSPEFSQALDQMRSIVEHARVNSLDDNLNGIIRVHCRQCRDKECKVPHIMAGCPPAGSSQTSSNNQTCSSQYPTLSSSPPAGSSGSRQTFSSDQMCSSQYPTRLCKELGSPVTFDQLANQSTDSEVQRHYEHNGPPGPWTPAQPSDDLTDNGLFQPDQDQTAPFSPQLPRQSYVRPHQIVPLGPSYLTSPSVHKRFPHGQPQTPDCVSPMGSGGFQMPEAAPVKGQQYQESQLGAEIYQQISDKGKGELRRPRERRLYQYIDPSRSGGSLRKMYGGSEHKLKMASAGEFPSYNTLPRKPGTVIYSSEWSELMPGDIYPCPHNVANVPDRDRLGKGGNGTVVKFSLGGKEYALKQTKYRENELNIWSTLDHPNILPLLGVMLGEPHTRDCFQFMPKMTSDLRSMMINHSDLATLLEKHPEQWEVVMSNVVYILQEVLKGLNYLDSENIQHSDIKANNILILKKCACPDILHCGCSGESKYEVKLADFDSLKKTTFKRNAAQFVEICLDQIMNDIDRSTVKGTPAYRAPEQFLKTTTRDEYKKTLQDGKVCHDMEGPWCDIWSLGIIVLQMILGNHNKEPYLSEASILVSHKASKMHARIEGPVAIIRLVRLLTLSHTHPELKPLAKLANECLEIDCRKRATAEGLLATLKQHTDGGC